MEKIYIDVTLYFLIYITFLSICYLSSAYLLRVLTLLAPNMTQRHGTKWDRETLPNLGGSSRAEFPYRAGMLPTEFPMTIHFGRAWNHVAFWRLSTKNMKKQMHKCGTLLQSFYRSLFTWFLMFFGVQCITDCLFPSRPRKWILLLLPSLSSHLEYNWRMCFLSVFDDCDFLFSFSHFWTVNSKLVYYSTLVLQVNVTHLGTKQTVLLLRL